MARERFEGGLLLPVKIPPRFREPLQRLAGLDPDRRAATIQQLITAEAFAPLHDLADKVSEAANISHEESLQIVLALLSFNVQLGAWDEPASAVAQSVANSKDLALDETARETLNETLNELLDAHSLATAAKAADLLTEHEHVYSGIRIVTDLRPIFGDDPTAEPEGVTLSATVKIDHYTDGRVKSLYFAADEEDLKAIRDAVDRALSKSDTMRKLMKANNLPLYRAEPGRV